MTKEKAKQKAEQGFKVRHESWLPHIYMHIGNTKYLDRVFSLYAQEHGWEVVGEHQLTIKEDVVDKILEDLNDFVKNEEWFGCYEIPIKDTTAIQQMREIIANNLNAKIEK